ncbi:hypothetical protein P691DRAFT_678252, partial [Macrolepiota fuliginosa MF-IS2]
ARAWATKITTVGALGVVAWDVVFVLMLIRSTFEGWRSAYDVSSEYACPLCVAFVISVFFDVKILHAGKASLQTRT